MESYVIPTKKDFLPGIPKRRLVSMRSKEADERYRRHYDAAIMRKDGSTIGEIADELSIHPGTVMNWLRRMIERGPGTNYKVRQGRPPKFTAKQLQELERDMKKSPRHYGLDSDDWTSRVVTRHVSARFDVEITPGSMRRIMTRTDMRWPGSAAATKARKQGG
ncbi:MAG: helix-turn-helix domain-containing protein [Thaumarchaeota archaeon]|nr:helix-turn-helix domain-containing protein [Nitrososphaerota archaeon]